MGLWSAHTAEKTLPLVGCVIILSRKSSFNLEMWHFHLTNSSWFANILLKRFTVAPLFFFNNTYWWCFHDDQYGWSSPMQEVHTWLHYIDVYYLLEHIVDFMSLLQQQGRTLWHDGGKNAIQSRWESKAIRSPLPFKSHMVKIPGL